MDGLEFDYVLIMVLDTYVAPILCILVVVFFCVCLVSLIIPTKGDVEHVHAKSICDFCNSPNLHDIYRVYDSTFAINVSITTGIIEIKHRTSSAYALLYPRWENNCTHEKLAKGIEDSIKFLL